MSLGAEAGAVSMSPSGAVRVGWSTIVAFTAGMLVWLLPIDRVLLSLVVGLPAGWMIGRIVASRLSIAGETVVVRNPLRTVRFARKEVVSVRCRVRRPPRTANVHWLQAVFTLESGETIAGFGTTGRSMEQMSPLLSLFEPDSAG